MSFCRYCDTTVGGNQLYISITSFAIICEKNTNLVNTALSKYHFCYTVAKKLILVNTALYSTECCYMIIVIDSFRNCLVEKLYNNCEKKMFRYVTNQSGVLSDILMEVFFVNRVQRPTGMFVQNQLKCEGFELPRNCTGLLSIRL